MRSKPSARAPVAVHHNGTVAKGAAKSPSVRRPVSKAPVPASKGARTEHDLLGEKRIPAAAYYGIQSARAMENFAISGVKVSLYPDFIRALAMVKLAAARANHDCDP